MKLKYPVLLFYLQIDVQKVVLLCMRSLVGCCRHIFISCLTWSCLVQDEDCQPLFQCWCCFEWQILSQPSCQSVSCWCSCSWSFCQTGMSFCHPDSLWSSSSLWMNFEVPYCPCFCWLTFYFTKFVTIEVDLFRTRSESELSLKSNQKWYLNGVRATHFKWDRWNRHEWSTFFWI